MTANEIINALSQLDLKSLSDEDFNKLKSVLSIKLHEANRITRGKTHCKTHFPSKTK